MANDSRLTAIYFLRKRLIGRAVRHKRIGRANDRSCRPFSAFFAFDLVSTGLRPWRQLVVPMGLSWIVVMELVVDDHMQTPGWCMRISAVLSIGIDAAFWGF
ncbi:hypothetical protein RBSH_03609 [Rhodopirellula baltica SH28]|uniref:Uncharacterized protein n=1 Tax=Rhodopirellula baltica SH28 TaxID=993517 RepID=K5E5N1_RHOBT|nr:hypothetical protein RBSH_03609 [Rhodopirellula baltica SH28]